ncbi:MAG: OmpA family protein [Bacteroidetes bacterium]|nr:OmpA family protein [Bacteroidota bacterium]
MKKIILLVLVLSLPIFIFSQNVQWAYKVVDFSSQVGTAEFSAKQVLGRPNVLPRNGKNANAWEPKGTGEKVEFIKVSFLTPMRSKYILVGESNHPGFISKVFAYDSLDHEKEVTSYTFKKSLNGSRLLNIDASAIDFKIAAVKIMFQSVKDVAVAIDAIGILQSDKPMQITLSESDMVKSNMIATKLTGGVNSQYPEMGPMISPDGNTLYFSRYRDPGNVGGKDDDEDIWYAEWDNKNNTWGEAKNIGSPLNNKYPNFINSISPDGNTILLGNEYSIDGSMRQGVSISHRTPTGWSFPQTVKIDDDFNRSEFVAYYLSNSQKYLLMAQEIKKNNYGSLDIYVSTMKADSTWTKPINLGPKVNTKGTETAPFLAADDRTLYYTSDGLTGYGGSDVYMTRRLDDSWTNWTEPENLGPKVNTSNNESFFTTSASGNKVYFTSESETPGDFDLYSLALPKTLKPSPVVLVRGKVLNSKTNETVSGVRIFFEDLANGKEAGIAISNPTTGEYAIVLPSGNNYGYLAEKKGFISVNANMDLSKLSEYKEMTQDLYIAPIEEGQTIAINNIFFDFDKYELKKESFYELERLATILKENPTMQVEISGHTDNIGNASYNNELSHKRAESVAKYLKDKIGVAESHVNLKDYGESKPIATNATAKGRQLNRRVEFKVISR